MKRSEESDFDRMVMVRLYDCRRWYGCFGVKLKNTIYYLPSGLTRSEAKTAFLRAIGAA
ncbi:MAG: hypothetical protein AB2761_20165 [Candidatus Thiodiazotropha endolucinida]